MPAARVSTGPFACDMVRALCDAWVEAWGGGKRAVHNDNNDDDDHDSVKH